jgi:hypothetical protein
MDFASFRKSIDAQDAAPEELSLALQALWWDAQGNWGQAHELAQQQDDAAGAWVHAYLHREEGDSGNAAYWYRRAGRTPAGGALAAEWEAIARALLDA